MPKTAHFPALDGARGFAAMLVVLSHASLFGMALPPLIDFSGIGKAGVYLFFVLSAFLLTLQWLENDGARLVRGRGELLRYAERRILRIWPLYLVVLLMSWLATLAGLAWFIRIDSSSLLRHLALAEGRQILWTIPVEFTFYLFIPPIAWLFFRLRARPWLVVGLTTAAIVALRGLFPIEGYAPNTPRLAPYLPLFLAGALTAFLFGKRQARPARMRYRWAGAGCLALVLLTNPPWWAALTGSPADHRVFHFLILGYAAGWCGLLWLVLRPGDLLGRFFSLPPLRWLGRVSFSIYLWHWPVLRWLQLETQALPDPLRLFLAIGVTLLCAGLSYRFIEAPFLRLRPVSGRRRMPRTGVDER